MRAHGNAVRERGVGVGDAVLQSNIKGGLARVERVGFQGKLRFARS